VGVTLGSSPSAPTILNVANFTGSIKIKNGAVNKPGVQIITKIAKALSFLIEELIKYKP